MLDERSIPALYRVHERPEPQSVLRLVDQLASLDVATPPVPEPLAPLAGGRDRRAVLGARRPARAPHRARPPGADVARPALAQAGPLLAGEPRPRRPAARRTTATSPRPSAAIPTSSAIARCSARSAGARTRRAPARSTRRPSGPRRASATRWSSSATPTTSRAASCSSATCTKAAGTRVYDGEVTGLIGAGRLRDLRRGLPGHAAGAPPARRLVGAQRAGDDAARHAHRRRHPPRRPRDGSPCARSTRRAAGSTSTSSASRSHRIGP